MNWNLIAFLTVLFALVADLVMFWKVMKKSDDDRDSDRKEIRKAAREIREACSSYSKTVERVLVSIAEKSGGGPISSRSPSRRQNRNEYVDVAEHDNCCPDPHCESSDFIPKPELDDEPTFLLLPKLVEDSSAAQQDVGPAVCSSTTTLAAKSYTPPWP